jgi:hypothetical protein
MGIIREAMPLGADVRKLSSRGSGIVTLVAQVMLGIRTRHLTFVTPNRTLDFGRNPSALIFRFLDYAHPS